MKKKSKQMWRSYQNGKEVLVEVGKEDELTPGFKWSLTHPWRDALDESIRKILDNIHWPKSISENRKKWLIKEIEAQQEIIRILDYKEELDLENRFNIPPKIHKKEMLQKYFAIAVGKKYGYLQKQTEYERNHEDYSFDPEHGFYSRMVAFIEYQLIKFVTKNGKLEFALSGSLNYINNDESLLKLFKDEDKFKAILKALIEKDFVKIDNDGGYIWVGNPKIMNDKLPHDAPGLQLVAFSLVIKPLLIDTNRKGAKMCRVLNEYFNCTYSEALFRGANRDNANLNYKIHFKFISS